MPIALSLPLTFAVFIAAVILVAVAGVSLVAAADRLTRKTRIGQALMGALFIGGITSLSGVITSVTAAATGYPSLAISNAVGGIAAQTVFIVVADMFHRRGNLEHDAASEATMIQGALLVVLLAIPLVAPVLPPVTIAGVHPVSVVLLLAFGFGIRLSSSAEGRPAWKPLDRWTGRTADGGTTATDSNADRANDTVSHDAGSPAMLWGRLAATAVVVAAGGLVLAMTAPAVAAGLGMTESAAGAFLTSIPTSMPELVTAIAAVRRGALVLAVSDILGGNCFDVLFLAFSDVAYRDGSLYHRIGTVDVGLMGLAMLLVGILLLGLLRRERSGIGRIGFEGWLILTAYATAAGFIVAA